MPYYQGPDCSILHFGYGDIGIGIGGIRPGQDDEIVFEALSRRYEIGENAADDFEHATPIIRLVFDKSASLQVLIDVATDLLGRIQGQEVEKGEFPAHTPLEDATKE